MMQGGSANMDKKIQTLVVLISTVVCVFTMLYWDKIFMYKNIVIDTIEKRHYEEKSKNEEMDNNKKVEEAAQVKEISGLDVISNKYKKIKMNSLAEQIENDKVDFFGQEKVNYDGEDTEVAANDTDIITSKLKVNENYDKDTDISKEEVSVFNTGSSNITKNLTTSDRGKLLSAASKLSAIDFEKVKEYLANGKDIDIKNALRLLKERLSEKDYEKVKEVAEKFIDRDIFEQ